MPSFAPQDNLMSKFLASAEYTDVVDLENQ